MHGAELVTFPEGAQRVARALVAWGHPHAPVMLDDAARTAQQAADALGVKLGQIAKSIVFRRKLDDVAVLVVISGDRRVDERKLETLVCLDGKRIGRADAEFVKSKTGFSIGGVSPLAHASQVLVLIDQSLSRFDEVWAAAGHPNAVFKLAPQALAQLTGAPVVDLAVSLPEAREARQNAMNLVAVRARAVSADDDNVPSPCISVCRISTETGLCEGCFRTLGEISAWSRSGPDAQRKLWQTISSRMASLPT